MALIDDLKAKIEQNPTGFSYTDQDIELVLNGQLDGTFKVTQEIEDFGEREFDKSYKDTFDIRVSGDIKSKKYQNLTYYELRFSINFLDRDSPQLKELLKNITKSELGPLFEEFSFNAFDVAVALKINQYTQANRKSVLQLLPTFTVQGDDGTNNSYNLIDNLDNSTIGNFSATPDRFKELTDGYSSRFGSNIGSQDASIGSENIRITGNPSEVSTTFKLNINLYKAPAQGFGWNQIIDVWNSVFGGEYQTPSGIITTRYAGFIYDSISLDSVTNIQAKFNAAVDVAAEDLLDNLVYEFEYNRRQSFAESAGELGPDASIDDILSAAEADALEDLADSGLAGEGGITRENPAVDPEDAQRFYEQCVLIANMSDLRKVFDKKIKNDSVEDSESDNDKELIHDPTPYQERFYMVQAPQGKNQRLLNFLSAPRGKKINDFLNITPDIQAFLTPKLRLFKVFNLNDGNLKQVEFIFKNTTSADTKLRRLFQDDSKFFRGSGYGIKSFSFSFNGTTPATAKNDITADLTLFFQDFSDFVTEFKTTEGTFKFVDLIFYDKKNENNPLYGYGATHPDQYSPAYFRIRADVGWNVPENDSQFDDACRKRGLDPDNIRDVIENTNRSYYLNMVEHDLDFKKDGTVEIKAQYRGFVESVLKGTDMDALVDSTILAERESRANTMRTAQRTCSPGEMARIKRIYAAQELKTIEKTRQRFFERLRELGKVHTYNVTDSGGFRTNGYFERQPKGDVILGSSEPNANQFNFYFLGDLLYVMLDTLYESGNISPNLKTKFIIPSIDFEAFFEGSENFTINIAQIPIADRFFEEWWTENVIKQDKRSFPIMFFLRKLLNDLVANALIDVCLNRDYQRSFNFQTTSINAAGDPLANIANRNSPVIELDTEIVPFSVPEGTKINDITDYIVVYPAYSTTLPIGSGDYTEDLENAVYHFHLGQDRGIINEVKFSKVDMQYIREARYKREGIDGLLQLGAVYTANLQMFGNTLFYPGMQIFINPFGIGGEEFLPNKEGTIANQLGLGGYHLITKVNSSIASGMFKTTVDAQFVYSGEGEVRFVKQGKNEADGETSIEESSDKDATCNKLVKAVEDDYTNLVATGRLTNEAAREAQDIEEDPSTFQASQQTPEELEAQNIAARPDDFGQTSDAGFIDLDGDGVDDNTGLDEYGFPPESEPSE